MECYFGRYIDDNKTILSSSGGAARAFAEGFINNGGIVLGVTYSKDFFTSEYFCASTIKELDNICGTKYLLPRLYIQNLNCSVFDFIKTNNKPVLFFGLGCLINALKTYIQAKNINSNIFYIELLCHGPTHVKVHKDYINFLQKKFSSNVVYFNIRYKKKLWKPFYLRAMFSNGKTYCKPFYNTLYGSGFSNLALDSCYSCKFKGDNHPGDIIVGDCWSESVSDYPCGLSLIIIMKSRGCELYNLLDKSIFITTKSSFDRIIRNNDVYFNSRENKSSNLKFKQNLYKKDLRYAVIKDRGLVKYLIHKFFKKID